MRCFLHLIFALLCFALATSCSRRPIAYRADSGDVRLIQDRWYVQNELLTGTVYQLSPEGDTLFVQSVKQGNLDGTAKQWYPRSSTGTIQLQEIRFYVQGKREGTHNGYWQNGNKKFEFTYINDVYQGTQKEWYASGIPYRIATYHEGHEHGLQQAFNDDGQLSVNYDARNGRNYGNIGKKRCKTVWGHDGASASTQSDSTQNLQAIRGRGGM